jgi:hypothetical protein
MQSNNISMLALSRHFKQLPLHIILFVHAFPKHVEIDAFGSDLKVVAESMGKGFDRS